MSRISLRLMSTAVSLSGMLYIVITSNIFPEMTATTPGYVEVNTKKLVDRVKSDIDAIAKGTRSNGSISNFLTGNGSGEIRIQGYVPPILDPWGQPVRARFFSNDDHRANLGIYSLGPDGLTHSEGDDVDDISSWGSVDNTFWQDVHSKGLIRRRLKLLLAVTGIGCGLFGWFLTLRNRY